MRRILLVTVLVVAALLVAAANADSVRVTRGDATAVLDAFGNGGWAILRHSPVVIGAPADGLNSGVTAIRPLHMFFNGNHYCVLDWHVALIAIFDGGDASYTAQDFEAFRSHVSIAFTLDGQSLVTDQTASKQFLRDLTAFGITAAYYFQQGRVMSPDELAVGKHTLRMSGSYPDRITFYVDPSGTGACL